MTPDWITFATRADWEDSLRHLLVEGSGAMKAGDAAVRDRVRADLVSYVDESPEHVAADLDTLALEGVRALSKAGDEGTMTDIDSRSADLARLTLSIGRGSGDGVAVSREVRLNWARREVASITTAVDALDGLRGSLRQGVVDEALAARIEGLLSGLREVRESVQQA